MDADMDAGRIEAYESGERLRIERERLRMDRLRLMVAQEQLRQQIIANRRANRSWYDRFEDALFG